MNWLKAEEKEVNKNVIRKTMFGVGKVLDILNDAEDRIQDVRSKYNLEKSSFDKDSYVSFAAAVRHFNDARVEAENTFNSLEGLEAEMRKAKDE